MLTIITLVITGLLTLLFFRHLNWGLALFIFALPFERIGAYSLNPVTGYPLIHPAQIIGLALIGAYGLSLMTRRLRLRPIASLPFLALFLATSTISAFLAKSEQVWQILAWLIFIVALFWVVAQLANRTNLNLIKRALAISVIVVSIFGLYQFFGDLAGLPNGATGIRYRYSKVVLGFPRLQSTALEPLYFANYLFLPLLILLALVVQARGKDKLTWVALGLGLIAFALTFSRGAFVAGAIGLLVLIVCLRDRFGGWAKAHLAPILAGAILLVLGLFLVVSLSVAQTKSKYNGLVTLKKFFITRVFTTGSFTERVRDQKLAIDIWRQQPIFGVGIGGFGSAYYGCHVGKCVYRPNNQALEVLAEGGLVGFATFHLFLLSVLYYSWRALKRTSGDQRALIAGLMAAEVSMVVQSQTFSGFLCCLTYTWATLALLAGLSANRKEVAAKATTSKPS